MSFSQKEYVFTQTMNKVSEAHQPAMFKIDLHGLIPFGDCSTLFIIDNMTVTAYKQGTLEKIPVKFTVLNDNKTRVLTNDPAKLSSEWNVDINGGSCIKIAGTDTVPFNRTLSVYDEDNRQALINVFAFMMSNSLWASDRAKGALDVLVASTRGKFQFTCALVFYHRPCQRYEGTQWNLILFSSSVCRQLLVHTVPGTQRRQGL